MHQKRRAFLTFALTTTTAIPTLSNAAPFFSKSSSGTNKGSSFLLLQSKDSTAATATPMTVREPLDIPYKSLSAESCLLGLLPVRNKVFRYLEKELQSVSRVRSSSSDAEIWKDVYQTCTNTLLYLDTQRSQLEPVFNQEDSTMLTITKNERGEQLVERLRSQVYNLCNATSVSNVTSTYKLQKDALYTLSQVGELLVPKYPYDIPSVGKYSYLPRLQGRTRVTFSIKRKEKFLGNVTIVADGYAAPITAGNFVDLCLRGFYTGLPVKYFKKRLSYLSDDTENDNGPNGVKRGGGGSGGGDETVKEEGKFASVLGKFKQEVQTTLADIEADLTDNTVTTDDDDDDSNTVVKSIPVLGSFGEGFYDPLTAKPRRIPLEIVRIDRLSGTLKLSYSGAFAAEDILGSSELTADGFSFLGGVGFGGSSDGSMKSTSTAKVIKVDNDLKKFKPLENNRPVLSFDIPGLVAWNHLDRQVNSGTAEFFSLPEKDITPQTTKLLNRQYAPFGYIIDGLDLMQNLKSGDVITSTTVDDWGALNLVKIRGTSFADVMSSGADDDEGIEKKEESEKK